MLHVVSSKFQELNNWKENNGEIQSLTNDKNTVYTGTKTSNNKGKLFKISENDTITAIATWDENNGEVGTLVSDNNRSLLAQKLAIIREDYSKLFIQ